MSRLERAEQNLQSQLKSRSPAKRTNTEIVYNFRDVNHQTVRYAVAFVVEVGLTRGPFPLVVISFDSDATASRTLRQPHSK